MISNEDADSSTTSRELHRGWQHPAAPFCFLPRYAHHQAETIFKAFALALKTACMVDPSKGDVLPSTKGLL